MAAKPKRKRVVRVELTPGEALLAFAALGDRLSSQWPSKRRIILLARRKLYRAVFPEDGKQLRKADAHLRKLIRVLGVTK